MDMPTELITQTHALLFKEIKETILPGIKYDLVKTIVTTAMSSIPVINRIYPPHNVAIPSIQGIVFNSDNEILQNMFYALLTKSMDKTQQNNTHPAFPQILGQISFDEIGTLYKFYVGETYFFRTEITGRLFLFHNQNIPSFQVDMIFEHLVDIGLINNLPSRHHIKIHYQSEHHIDSLMHLSLFGQQFIEACLSPEAEKLIQELIDNA